MDNTNTNMNNLLGRLVSLDLAHASECDKKREKDKGEIVFVERSNRGLNFGVLWSSDGKIDVWPSMYFIVETRVR